MLIKRILLLGTVMLWLGSAGAARARNLQEIRAAGELRMLTFPHQESAFSRTNLDLGPMPRSGDPRHFIGIDVDLIHAFAQSLGVALVIQPVSEPSYSALIPDLLAGRGDLIASSFSITKARQQNVDFSTPYFTVHPVIVTHQDSAIHEIADLAKAIGSTTAGSSHETRLLALGIPEAKLSRVDFSAEAYGAVLEGDAGYTLADSTSARLILQKESTLKVAFRLPEEDHYGIALPKDNDLKPKLDHFLEQLRSSGKLTSIIDRQLSPQGLAVGRVQVSPDP